MKKLILVISFTLLPLQLKAMCVIADIANLRKGPGSRYKISWTVGKYMPLLQVGRKRDWYKVVDLEGQTHWIFSGLVSKRIRCVAVKRRTTTLRTGPGKSFAVAGYGQADRYTPFKRLAKKDNWYNIIDASGNKAWVFERDVWRPIRVARISF